MTGSHSPHSLPSKSPKQPSLPDHFSFKLRFARIFYNDTLLEQPISKVCLRVVHKDLSNIFISEELYKYNAKEADIDNVLLGEPSFDATEKELEIHRKACELLELVEDGQSMNSGARVMSPLKPDMLFVASNGTC